LRADESAGPSAAPVVALQTRAGRVKSRALAASKLGFGGLGMLQMAVVCGTNRADALSRLLAREAAQTYRDAGHAADLIDMAELPVSALDPHAYREKTADLQALIDRFLRCEGAVFIIPEYNGSYPGVLKLFVDMLPFPQGFEGRPCAFIGLAAGQFKSLRAVEHFQQVAGYRNAYVYPKRLFIGDSFQKFIDGKLADDELTQRLREQAIGFADFVTRLRQVPRFS
jgi:NAD(P)H-dependent FMN reductase